MTKADPAVLKKTIADLKAKLPGFKDVPKHDPKVRQVTKALRRAQRKLALLVPPGPEALAKKLQKNLDEVGKVLGELTKGAKKVVGNPYHHSLRKKTKSLNKRIKRANKVVEAKKPPPEKAAAPAAPAPQA